MANEPVRAAEPAVADIPGRTVAVAVIAGAAALPILQYARPLVVPVLLALLLAYALEPFVALLVRVRLPRSVAAVLVFGLLLTGIHAGGSLATDRVNAFLADLPGMVASVKQRMIVGDRHSPSVVGDLSRAASEIERATAAVSGGGAPLAAKPVTVVERRFDLSSVFLDNGLSMATAAAYAFAVALLTFLLLAAGDVYRHKILRLGGPAFESRRITFEVMRAIDRQIERYLVVRILISAIVAALTAAVLWPIGLSHWLAWGIVAGILNVLPFVGPTIAVALIALAAFVQFNSLALVAAAGGLSGLVAMLEGNVLTPWLTSRAGELNTVAVFIGVLFWGWVWGIWGLLLAVPLLVATKAAAEHIEPLQPLAELLGR